MGKTFKIVKNSEVLFAHLTEKAAHLLFLDVVAEHTPGYKFDVLTRSLYKKQYDMTYMVEVAKMGEDMVKTETGLFQILEEN